MNLEVAHKLRTLTLAKRQQLLLQNPSLSDWQPDEVALEALDAALQPGPSAGGDAA